MNFTEIGGYHPNLVHFTTSHVLFLESAGATSRVLLKTVMIKKKGIKPGFRSKNPFYLNIVFFPIFLIKYLDNLREYFL